MSTEIDPRIVRDVAESAFRSTDGGSPAERVETALIASGVAGPVLGERFDVWTRAVAAEYERLVARKIARDHIRSGRGDIGMSVIHHFGMDLADEEFFTWERAVHEALENERRTVSWPDEQQDDAALAETVVRLQRWLAGRQGKVHSVVSSTNVIAEPRDRFTAAWAIAESDVAAVVAALEARITKADA